MKVDAGGPVRASGGPGLRRHSAGPAGRFSVESQSGAPSAALSGGAPLASMSALLAVQAAEDPLDGRSRGQKRGASLLDRLEEIRLGLLSDGIPRHALRSLAAELKLSRADCGDPALAAILGEIELRALVELAKYDDGAAA